MTNYADFMIRFPEFVGYDQNRWMMFQEDAVLEMGPDDGRWINVYNTAQYYLMAHLMAVGDMQAAGDTIAVGPIRSTEVDDVVVEYAVSKTSENSFDEYLGTSYGQRYMKYRRMAFAGPRAV